MLEILHLFTHLWRYKTTLRNDNKLRECVICHLVEARRTRYGLPALAFGRHYWDEDTY